LEGIADMQIQQTLLPVFGGLITKTNLTGNTFSLLQNKVDLSIMFSLWAFLFLKNLLKGGEIR